MKNAFILFSFILAFSIVTLAQSEAIVSSVVEGSTVVGEQLPPLIDARAAAEATAAAEQLARQTAQANMLAEMSKQTIAMINKLKAIDLIFVKGNRAKSYVLVKSMNQPSIIAALTRITYLPNNSEAAKMIADLEKRISKNTKIVETDEANEMCSDKCISLSEEIARDRLDLAALYRGEIAKKSEAYLKLSLSQP